MTEVQAERIARMLQVFLAPPAVVQVCLPESNTLPDGFIIQIGRPDPGDPGHGPQYDLD